MSEPGKWGARVGTVLFMLFAVPLSLGINRLFALQLSSVACVVVGIMCALFALLTSIRDGDWD